MVRVVVAMAVDGMAAARAEVATAAATTAAATGGGAGVVATGWAKLLEPR